MWGACKHNRNPVAQASVATTYLTAILWHSLHRASHSQSSLMTSTSTTVWVLSPLYRCRNGKLETLPTVTCQWGRASLPVGICLVSGTSSEPSCFMACGHGQWVLVPGRLHCRRKDIHQNVSKLVPAWLRQAVQMRKRVGSCLAHQIDTSKFPIS